MSIIGGRLCGGFVSFLMVFSLNRGKSYPKPEFLRRPGMLGMPFAGAFTFRWFYKKFILYFILLNISFIGGVTISFCRGQAPEKAWTDLWLVAGHMSVREWATLNVSYQSLDAGYIPSGELGLLRRRIGWMPGIPSGLVPEKGLSRYGGLVDGISKVGFPRWGRSAARGQASVRLLWQGFQGSVQPTGGRPPKWNPSTFNIIE